MTWLTFDVMACSDVHVMLVAELFNPDAPYFEIIISGWDNSRTVIRDLRERTLRNVSTPGLLSCDDTRTFWVSWDDEGLLEVVVSGLSVCFLPSV